MKITQSEILEQAEAVTCFPFYDSEIGLTEKDLVSAYRDLRLEAARLAVMAVKFAKQ